MTRLFIDDQEVVLPEQFELELITENPYFTRNGEYTYDIDIDLRVPQNRQIYKNIQRSDVTTKINNRTAVITAGTFELIHGIEVVLSVDNYIAKIQIVAGNSQLNYNGEQRIRDIQIDSVNYTDDEAVQSLYGTSKTHHAVYTPVVAYRTYEGFYNNLDLRGGAPVFNHKMPLLPQYYLIYILENMIEKLGFKKGRNYIEDYFWQRVFIVNTRPELKPQETLPDWTVNEFFDEIEMYLHCIIIVDKFTGIYNIYKRSSYFNYSSLIYIDDVLDDDIIKKYDTDVSYSYNYDLISYDFPDKERYKYYCLNESVKPLAQVVTVGASEDIKPEEYPKYYDKPYLLHASKYDIDFAVVKLINEAMSSKNEYYTLRVVDRFADAGDKNAANKTSFKIVPADVWTVNIWNYDGKDASCPAVLSITDTNASSESIGITDLINGNVQIEPYIPDRIYIGIYYGLQKMTTMKNGEFTLTEDEFPCSYTDHYFFDETTMNTDVYPVATHVNKDYTLSFIGDTGLMAYYQDDEKIDTSIEYSFKFITNKTYDLRQIFVIRNKKYFCKEIRYTITPKGLDKVAEGIFYLVE